MAEITPGFRFYPTEEELVSFYLHNKLEGTRQDINCVIPMINIFDLEPWHLPSKQIHTIISLSLSLNHRVVLSYVSLDSKPQFRTLALLGSTWFQVHLVLLGPIFF